MSSEAGEEGECCREEDDNDECGMLKWHGEATVQVWM